MSEIQFLPWMRLGLAASIGQGAPEGSAVSIQPHIDILADRRVADTVQGPTIQLRGPGNVVALNSAEIKRRAPEPGATGAETNYFCSVEFFAPDLPWRYTPTPVDADGHLQPWLVLVVVELGPDVSLSKGRRVPILTVDSPKDHLPDLADAWAWAHVQAATSLDGSVAQAYENDPSAFTSRLLCPRRLRADTPYTACIVPAFKAGRESGLGFTPTPSTALDHAWQSDNAIVELPVYDSWELTAGDNNDFKTLARRIKPDELPEDVGFRDLDLSDPGIGLPEIAIPATFVGAMHAPNDGLVYWANKKDQEKFETAVRRRLDATPVGRQPRTGFDPLVHDPVVTPSVYGAPQVGSVTVPEAPRTPGWFEELNIGPHHRSVAGLGAEVVRADQEALMAAAWDQASAVIDVNRTLNRGRLAQEVATQLQRKWDRLGDATAVSIATPALVSMRVDGTTAKRLVDAGDAPSVYFGATFRRLGRPNGPLSTSANVQAARSPAMAVTRAAIQSARGEVANPPESPLSTGFRTRYLPSGMDVGADLLAGDDASGGLAGSIDRSGIGPASPLITDGGVQGARSQFVGRSERADMRRRIAALSTRRLSTPGDIGRVTPFEPPSDDVIDYPDGILDFDLEPFQFEVVRPITSGRIATTEADQGHLGVDLTAAVRAAVQPAAAIVTAVKNRLVVPGQTWEQASMPTQVRLEPRFTDPMYERVRALSVDYLVPGVGAVRNNTLGLLEVNPAYVEAFLVGLNHEMSRELRWREYPAALGQTWFQHFWDNIEPAPPDIPPITTWPKNAALGDTFGDHDPSDGDEAAPALVALIKADLIRKFPDVRVYAIPAKWDGTERVPDDKADPVGPGFVGTLQRGVNFYGFPGLSEEAARGDNGTAGWFFVLEEEPRAMRFGLDRGTAGGKGKNPKNDTWANLAWANLAEKDEVVPWFCTIDTIERIETAEFDGLAWGDDAAVMAAITFRRPIQVFLHASAMLPEPGGTDNDR